MKALSTRGLVAFNNRCFKRCLMSIGLLAGCLMSLPLIVLSQANAGYNMEYGTPDSVQKKNVVSIELGGNAIIYSINYSRIVITGINNRLYMRFGFAYLPISKLSHFFLLPGELYLQTGKMDHHFELGTGITYEFRVKDYSDDHLYNYIFLRVGYSYQKPGGRFYYRVGFTPFTGILSSSLDRLIMPFGGISVGYLF